MRDAPHRVASRLRALCVADSAEHRELRGQCAVIARQARRTQHNGRFRGATRCVANLRSCAHRPRGRRNRQTQQRHDPQRPNALGRPSWYRASDSNRRGRTIESSKRPSRTRGSRTDARGLPAQERATRSVRSVRIGLAMTFDDQEWIGSQQCSWFSSSACMPWVTLIFGFDRSCRLMQRSWNRTCKGFARHHRELKAAKDRCDSDHDDDQ